MHELTEAIGAGSKADKEKEDGEEVLTRDEQLRFKASSKVKRSAGESGKGKKAKSNKGKGKKKSKAKGKKRGTDSKGISRKRQVLRKSKRTKDDKDDYEPAKDEGGETSEELPPKQIKRPRKTREPTKPKKTDQRAKDPVKPKAKAKGKAKAKASPTKGTRSKADPKAKVKASPKAKASCRRGKKKVGSEASLEDQKNHEHYSAELVDKLVSFAKQVDTGANVKSEAFKVGMRKKLVEMNGYRLNIYWTRQSCGVTNTTEGKDLGTFSFNGSSASDAERIAVAIKCSELMVT